MALDRIGTIFTGVLDTFASLLAQSGLSKPELIALNPHLAELDEITPGIPVDVPLPARQKLMSSRAGKRRAAAITPYQVARTELLKDVREVQGSGDNPRIVEYHASTSPGARPS
jgi:hypothetical protein